MVTVAQIHSIFFCREQISQSTKPVNLENATAIRVPTYQQRNTVYPEPSARRIPIATMICSVKEVLATLLM